MSMSEEEKNEVLEYWNYLDSLPDDVRQAVLLVWDETGRPVNEMFIGITKLLDKSDTYREFHEKYSQFLGPFHGKSEYQVHDEARTYFYIYMGGIDRAGKNLT